MLFQRKKYTDLADIEYQKAKRRAYGRQVIKIARSSGHKAGIRQANERFSNQRVSVRSVTGERIGKIFDIGERLGETTEGIFGYENIKKRKY